MQISVNIFKCVLPYEKKERNEKKKQQQNGMALESKRNAKNCVRKNIRQAKKKQRKENKNATMCFM